MFCLWERGFTVENSPCSCILTLEDREWAAPTRISQKYSIFTSDQVLVKIGHVKFNVEVYLT